jgi:hypothetical protein
LVLIYPAGIVKYMQWTEMMETDDGGGQQYLRPADEGKNFFRNGGCVHSCGDKEMQRYRPATRHYKSIEPMAALVSG